MEQRRRLSQTGELRRVALLEQRRGSQLPDAAVRRLQLRVALERSAQSTPPRNGEIDSSNTD